jgi:predicted metal-dependent hydrolase
VAFDVYRAVGGGERLRIITMKLVRYGFVIGMTIQVIASLLMDRETYQPGVLRKSWRHVRRQPLLSRQVWDTLKAYERRGFHPSDIPNDELVEVWRERLFGAEGTMAAVTGRRQVA